MSLKIDGKRRSRRLGAVCASALVVLALVPGIAFASDAAPVDRSGYAAAKSWMSGIESLWSAVAGAWNGLEGLVVSGLGQGPVPTASASEPACAPDCGERSADLDPDG